MGDFDDYPDTELDDDEYDAFVAREFDRDGHLRDGPPVARWILWIIALLVVAAVWAAL